MAAEGEMGAAEVRMNGVKMIVREGKLLRKNCVGKDGRS